MLEIHCIVTGQVQNVAYRDYVQNAATELGIVGWVRNTTDGSVEICAQGLPESLKEFVEYIWEGSLEAKVDSVAVDWRTAKKKFDDFNIIYT